MNNIIMLEDTLKVCNQGYYMKDGKKVKLKLSKEQMKGCQVFLPPNIHSLNNFKKIEHDHVIGRCRYSCENIDAFSLARKTASMSDIVLNNNDSHNILVLNLANPVNPGGGVRFGAQAQEEDLCRKSSLLLSLESNAAESYYSYNRLFHTYMGSDGIIITPNVEIIKDENGELLDETVVVSVMTCAAPMITNGIEGLSDEEYQNMVYGRITCMLLCAAFLGYKQLILGAFGCGAFGNDAKVISDIFYKALKEFRFDGVKEKDMFRRIDFAVLCSPGNDYNFKEFYRNFGGNNFYREEDNDNV